MLCYSQEVILFACHSHQEGYKLYLDKFMYVNKHTKMLCFVFFKTWGSCQFWRSKWTKVIIVTIEQPEWLVLFSFSHTSHAPFMCFYHRLYIDCLYKVTSCTLLALLCIKIHTRCSFNA